MQYLPLFFVVKTRGVEFTKKRGQRRSEQEWMSLRKEGSPLRTGDWIMGIQNAGRVDRLSNIRIESYTWDTQNLRVFAMLKLHLNTAQKPIVVIQKGREDLQQLIADARNTLITETANYDGNRNPLNQYLRDLDSLELTEDFTGRLQRFLADCKEELENKKDILLHQ